VSEAGAIQDIRATPMVDVAATLHTRELTVNGEDVLDHVIILRAQSDSARDALRVMRGMMEKRVAKPFIFQLKNGDLEIVVRTKPHWEDA
jgi:hypothetical protein